MRGEPRIVRARNEPSSNSPSLSAKKEKAGNLSAPAPKNLHEGQVYGPEILAVKTTKRISTQQVIIWFVYHESRLAVNVVGKYTSI